MSWYSIFLIIVAFAAVAGLGGLAFLTYVEVKRRRGAHDAPLSDDPNVLNLQKLQLEVRDLLASSARLRATNRLSLATAAVATTTTLAIAIGGWAIGADRSAGFGPPAFGRSI